MLTEFCSSERMIVCQASHAIVVGRRFELEAGYYLCIQSPNEDKIATAWANDGKLVCSGVEFGG